MKKSPNWMTSGLMMFPIIVSISGILWLGSMFIEGKCFNFFIWLIIPSIIFEEMFEWCCPLIADSYLLNLFFALLFWFAIGAIFGLLLNKLKKIIK